MPNLLKPSLALLALGVALAAPADQIVHSFSIDGQTGRDSYSIPAFDPNLGTLTSVVVDLSVANHGTITYTNLGNAAAGQHLTTSSYGEVDMYRNSDFRTVGEVSGERDESSAGPLAQNGSFTNSLDYVGGPSTAYTYDNAGNRYDTADGVFTGRAVERFYGRNARDLITLLIYDEADYDVSDLPDSSLDYDFEGLTSGSITFNYTPQAVPEPASCAALGLGALALLRRRRR